ncbi:MAG: acyltransferase family protein, partial [Pseudomonadota bacterium]
MTSVPPRHLEYRPHIDGLRAFAVLLVLLFHAFPEDVPGGFIGVDLFFVISGYLITQLIQLERGAGIFSYQGFLLRRVRRLAPAFLLVGCVSLVVAAVGFLPEHFQRNAAAFASSLLLSSNWYFFANTDYFAADNWTNLYLHNWSLSVEEQFYLFYPLILLALPAARLRRGLLVLLGAGFMIATAAVFLSSPQKAFFATYTRVWELMLGCVLAVYKDDIRTWMEARHWACRALRRAVVPGLLVIIACAGLITEESGIPGPIMLVPLIAFLPALLVRDLWPDRPGGGSGWLFENRTAVYIGAISYALYLWHWPILTLVRHLMFDPEDWHMAVALLPAVGLAALTYHFVEQPVRRRRVLAKPVKLLGCVSAVWAMIMMACVVVITTEGLPGRISDDVNQILAGTEDKGGENRRWPPFPDTHPLAEDALWAEGRRYAYIGKSMPGEAPLLLWGDSHAGALTPGLSEVARREGFEVAVLDKAACPPLIGLGWINFSREEALACEAHNEATARLIESGQFPVVLMVGHWDIFAPRKDGRAGSIIAVHGPYAPDGLPDQREEEFLWALEYTVRRLAPHAELRFLLDVPSHPRPVPDMLAREKLWPMLPPAAVETRAGAT